METISGKLQIISASNHLLAEGPLWDAVKQVLYFVDIRGQRLHAIDWNTDKASITEVPQQVGFASLKKDGGLLFGMEDGVYEQNPKGEFVLVNEKTPIAGLRFNDGKPGPNGMLYAGTILREGGAKLYSMGKDKILHTLIDDSHISNGLDWSMDEKTMYYIDTLSYQVDAFDYDKATGNISNRRTVIKIPKEIGCPDGMTIDTEDMLWIALWNGGKVVRANPKTGELIAEINLPVSRVSCPVFAGKALDELVVTSSSNQIDLDKEPQAGYVYKIKLPYKGRAPYRY